MDILGSLYGLSIGWLSIWCALLNHGWLWLLNPQNGHLVVQKQIFFEWMESNFPVGYDTLETGYE